MAGARGTATARSTMGSLIRANSFSVWLDGFAAGLDLRALGYACVESVATEHATHVVLRK